MSVLPLDQERWMAVKLNHTIVWCRDKEVSASYLAEVLGLEAPRPWGAVPGGGDGKRGVA